MKDEGRASFTNILVRGTSWMGDSIITLPALHELRRVFPSAKITLMVKPWLRDIFSSAGVVDEVIAYDRKADGGLPGLPHMAKVLRDRHFDAAILFQNAFEAAVLPFFAGIPVRIGYPTDWRSPLLTHSPKPARETLEMHQVYYYLHLVSWIEERFFGRSQVDLLHPHYHLEASGDQREAARALLDRMGIDRSKRLIALNPGATNSEAKRWLPERFAALADRMLTRGDCAVVLVGGKAEVNIASQVTDRMSAMPVRLTGQTSVPELIGVLSLCDLVVSNDTGPAYVAAALCRPTLTIFGPTNLYSICPMSPTSHFIFEPVHCSPCMLKHCPTQHECMTGVTVESVYRRAIDLIEGTST